MVPKGWEIKHLSELASKISDGIHKTPLYADTSEIYFINGNNLKSGSIVERGNHQELLKNRGLYSHLCELQTFA